MQIKTTLTLITTLFIGLVLFFAIPSQAHASAQNVAGHIYYAGTTNPVSGVWVRWQDIAGHIRFAQTDSQGYYFFASWQGQYECGNWADGGTDENGNTIYYCDNQREVSPPANRNAEYANRIDTDLNGSKESRQSNTTDLNSYGCQENNHTFSVVLPSGWSGSFSSSQAAVTNTTINVLEIDLFYSPDQRPPTGSITIDRQFVVRYSSIESMVRITGNISATSPGTVGGGLYVVKSNGAKVDSCPTGIFAGNNCQLAYSSGQTNISLSYDWTPNEYGAFQVFITGDASYGQYCSGNPTVTIPGTYGGYYFESCGPTGSAFMRSIYPPYGSISASSTSVEAGTEITLSGNTTVNSPATVGSLGLYIVNQDGSQVTTCTSGVFAGNNCRVGAATSSGTSTASISRTWTPTDPGSYYAFLAADDNWSNQFSFHCSGNPKVTLPGSYGPYYFYKCANDGTDRVAITVAAIPVPTLGALSFGADTGRSAVAAPTQTVGKRTSQSGSNHYNPLRVSQSVSNVNSGGANVDLVGIAFVSNTSLPSTNGNALSRLKQSADAGSGFVVVYAHCGSTLALPTPPTPVTCSEDGKTFTSGKYYIYTQGAWAEIIDSISIADSSGRDMYLINIDSSANLETLLSNQIISVEFFKDAGNKTWATYGYLKGNGVNTFRRTN